MKMDIIHFEGMYFFQRSKVSVLAQHFPEWKIIISIGLKGIQRLKVLFDKKREIEFTFF